jgi:hypothetical protein
MPDEVRPLFDGWPEAERTIVIPETLELKITQFIHRWGYSTTAQERMRPEIVALIAFAKGEQ